MTALSSRSNSTFAQNGTTVQNCTVLKIVQDLNCPPRLVGAGETEHYENFFEAQERGAPVYQAIRKVPGLPRNCSSGTGYTEIAGADCLGARGDQRTNARTGTSPASSRGEFRDRQMRPEERTGQDRFGHAVKERLNRRSAITTYPWSA